MKQLRLLSLATLGLAVATTVAPNAGAQQRRVTAITVCRDGTRIDNNDARVCERRGGIDVRATESARRYEADRVANGNRDDRRDQRDDRRDARDDRRDRRDDNQSGDPRYDGRGNNGGYGNSGGYSNGRNVAFEFQGTVDKEIQIQLRGNRGFVQPIGAGDTRANRGLRVVNGIPNQEGTLVVERLAGRGDVDIIQQPSSGNGYTATLRVRDRQGGADNYRIIAYFQPSGNGRYGYGRN